MDHKQMVLTILISIIVLTSCCIELPISRRGRTTTTTTIADNQTLTPAVTTTLPGKIPVIPQDEMPTEVSQALSSYDYYSYENPTITSHARSITEGCEDNECKLLKIHKYVIDNFYYMKYKNASHGIAGIFNTRYGICSDFAVFYYNYLKSVDLETYVAIIPEHTYALSCNLNLTRLQGYIEEDPDFSNYTQEYIFPNFEFELAKAFNKTCLRIEGPSSTKGHYRYPGEHYEETKIVENKSFLIDPEKWVWEPFDESMTSIERPRAHIKRRLNFALNEKRSVSWSVKKIQKRIDGGLDYEFIAYDLGMTTTYYYADFTLPELDRFDRVRIHVNIQSIKPIVFYTLQDEKQLDNFEYYMEHRYTLERDDIVRVDEKPRTGSHPYEFEYISSCSQEEASTFFDKECIISDAGSRVFVIHNEKFFEENEINVTTKYVEFL